MNFKTHCHGKWILAGEHAVLRGAPAILFPLSCCQLNLEYLASNTPWQIQLSGNLNETHLPLIQQVLQHAFELSKKTPPSRGTLCIENHIPTGSGLGASAALCTAIAKWFMHATWILENNLLEFGRQLENLFHGESSGADIAVSALNQSIYFIRHETPHPFTFTWQPHWYLSYCGEQSTTSDCLKQVDLLWKKNPAQAHATHGHPHQSGRAGCQTHRFRKRRICIKLMDTRCKTFF